jgi:hypothetical protein
LESSGDGASLLSLLLVGSAVSVAPAASVGSAVSLGSVVWPASLLLVVDAVGDADEEVSSAVGESLCWGT